jgi:hypothetical protein
VALLLPQDVDQFALGNTRVSRREWGSPVPGGGHNHVVGRISPESSKRSGGNSDFWFEGQQFDARRTQRARHPLVHLTIELEPTVNDKTRDFPTTDGTDAYGLSSIDAAPRAGRQLFRTIQPPYPSMGIEDDHDSFQLSLSGETRSPS